MKTLLHSRAMRVLVLLLSLSLVWIAPAVADCGESCACAPSSAHGGGCCATQAVTTSAPAGCCQSKAAPASSSCGCCAKKAAHAGEGCASVTGDSKCPCAVERTPAQHSTTPRASAPSAPDAPIPPTIATLAWCVAAPAAPAPVFVAHSPSPSLRIHLQLCVLLC